MLRLSIAPTSGTDFYVPCPHCGLPLEGHSVGHELETHSVQFKRAEKVALELNDDTPVVTIDPNTPLRLDAKSNRDFCTLGVSSNATFGLLLGPRAIEGTRKLAQFRYSMVQHWPRYAEAIQYYISGQWEYFEAAIDDILDVTWVDTGMRSNQRHRMALVAAQYIMILLQPDEYGRDLIDDYIILGAPTFSNASLRSYAYKLEMSSVLPTMRADLYRVFTEFMNAWEMWLPGLTVKMVQPSQEAELANLRIARNDFGLLRDLYLQTSETICKSLSPLMAIVNTSLRGLPDSFGSPPQSLLENNAKEKAPTSLRKYEHLNCSRKLTYATEWPK